MASATRLETLEKTRATGKITGAAAEIKEESKENDPVSELVDRFGIVLARLESMPQQGKNPGASGGKYNERGHDKPRQQYQNKNYQSRPNTGAPAAAAGGEGKGQELNTKETGETPKNKEGYSYEWNNYRRWEYDRHKYCITHQKAGHSTGSCAWLKASLKEIPPPEKTYYGKKEQGN